MLPLLLAALAPVLASAQSFISPDAALRDTLRAFEERMRAQPMHIQAAAPLEEYVLVWVDHCDGGSPFISSGGQRTLASLCEGRPAFMDPAFIVMPGMPGRPLFYGDRYAFIDVELPTGLVRYTRWYFERKP